MGFPKTPALVADCVVFDMEGWLLLVRRGSDPFKGWHSLPGGFVDEGETVEAACVREVEASRYHLIISHWWGSIPRLTATLEVIASASHIPHTSLSNRNRSRAQMLRALSG